MPDRRRGWYSDPIVLKACFGVVKEGVVDVLLSRMTWEALMVLYLFCQSIRHRLGDALRVASRTNGTGIIPSPW
jgi:hypothetical protein